MAATESIGSRPLRVSGVLLVWLAACHPAAPQPTHGHGNAAPITEELGGPISGIASDGKRMFVARSTPGGTGSIAARALAAPDPASPAWPAWNVELQGVPGPLMVADGAVVATMMGRGPITGLGAPFELRGEPSGVVVSLDPATGKLGWRMPFVASEFCVITAIAPILEGKGGAQGIVIGGVFSGTLRAGDAANRVTDRNVVASAGRTDGFVALLGTDGSLKWLVRAGGLYADAVQGVAARNDRIAVAGTLMATAELLGTPLDPIDDKVPLADGWVAELDLAGRRRWSQTFGSPKQEDAVAGIAIDAEQRVAVAATVRGATKIGDREVTAHGDADGLVAYWSPGGELLSATSIGGDGFDGLRGIAAAGDRVVVAGYSGNEAFVVGIGANGQKDTPHAFTGAGREDVTALTALPGGFIAAVGHTAAAEIDGVAVPAPADPAAGATVIVRPAP